MWRCVSMPGVDGAVLAVTCDDSTLRTVKIAEDNDGSGDNDNMYEPVCELLSSSPFICKDWDVFRPVSVRDTTCADDGSRFTWIVAAYLRFGLVYMFRADPL